MDRLSPLYLITWLILWFVISIYVKTDVVDLELMKAWGSGNYNRLIKIYKSDAYKQQQSSLIDMLEAQIYTWSK